MSNKQRCQPGHLHIFACAINSVTDGFKRRAATMFSASFVCIRGAVIGPQNVYIYKRGSAFDKWRDLIIPWSRVIPDKLICPQLVRKFPEFYETRKFITATCPYLEPNQSSPRPHSTSRRSISILSSHLRLRFPSGLLPSDFPTRTLYSPLLSPHTGYMPGASQAYLFNHPYGIWWGVHSIKLLVM